MKLYEYFKTSVFEADANVVILMATYYSGGFRTTVTVKGKSKDIRLQNLTVYLDAYVVGQSVFKNTVYIVCTRDPDFEGVGLRGYKFSSDSLGFLSSLMGGNHDML